MSSCYLDANVLVYLQDPNSPFHQKSIDLVKKLVDDRHNLIISPLVLDEYLHSSLRSSKKSPAEKLANVRLSMESIFKLPEIKLVNPPLAFKKQLKILKLMAKFNLKPRDAYHLLIVIEKKINFLATFDQDFARVFEVGLIKKFS